MVRIRVQNRLGPELQLLVARIGVNFWVKIRIGVEDGVVVRIKIRLCKREGTWSITAH